MKPLEKKLRNKLEQIVQQARVVAEEAARAAVTQLGVGEPAPYKHLSEEERKLRVKLRAHGRQLGDKLNQKDQTQDVTMLVEEIAYQHWHRMLFTRFLAENELLIYPDPEVAVAVTLEECAELAAESSEARNGWELAAHFAARMLPQIFRPDSPVFQLNIPLEHQRKLEQLLEALPQEIFTASDSLGWVYQYWQSQKKDEVNASGVKIGSHELPAVTQLFTEPYMVHFLLDNSLGAWWASKVLSAEDLRTASSEDELRHKAARPGLPLKYLRFVKTEEGSWTPAAGTFSEWPDHLGELKVLDPCCGSGHFLVSALLMLVPMRMELEGLTAAEAVDAVLRDNLHGLEIDQRCVELAAFALAFAAWRHPGAGGYRQLPELNLACSGLSVSVSREKWRKLANSDAELEVALGWLHDQFSQAPLLGSLLNPARSEAALLVEWDNLSQALARALQKERSDEEREVGIVAQGLARTADMLGGRYHWVITNVPYLAGDKQIDSLKEYCANYYKDSRGDLATVFLERCLDFCLDGGTVSIVLPQNWLFLVSYKKLRQKLLRNETWRLVARLGAGAFQTPMWDFNVQLLTISHGRADAGGEGIFTQGEVLEHLSWGLDLYPVKGAIKKALELTTANLEKVYMEKVHQILSFGISNKPTVFGDIVIVGKGICTGDSLRFIHKFWEQLYAQKCWVLFRTSVNCNDKYSGCENLLLWENCKGQFFKFVKERLSGNTGAWIRGKDVWDQNGISVSRVSGLAATLYCGEKFDDNAAVLIPKNKSHLPAIWCYITTGGLEKDVYIINQKLSIDNAYLRLARFDLNKWLAIARKKYPCGLPKPFSNDPTQWIFHGHPCGSVIFNEHTGLLERGPHRMDETVLQVAVVRLLGYRWPAELDSEMELSDESRYWVEKSAGLFNHADSDGIVCLPAVRGERSAADRLLDLLVACYGEQWHPDILSRLLEQVDHAGKTLGTWLQDKFFAQHCRLFHQRPFIWHIWDGLRDGFAALLNYHMLDRKNLETLTYTYLGDWISRQKQDLEQGIDSAAEKLAAAEALQKRLELILEGEDPYDIFVRWKPIEEQPLGWDPDLNDGVRLNIRPFMKVPAVGPKGAGILRVKPNIKWGKDRGKDVSSAPWYHLFEGDRINDHHLSLEEKLTARKRE